STKSPVNSTENSPPVEAILTLPVPGIVFETPVVADGSAKSRAITLWLKPALRLKELGGRSEKNGLESGDKVIAVTASVALPLLVVVKASSLPWFAATVPNPNESGETERIAPVPEKALMAKFCMLSCHCTVTLVPDCGKFSKM